MTKYFPHSLAGIFILFFILLGIAPVSREVWLAEIIPVVIIFSLFLFTYKQFQFSPLAYGLVAFWLFWHTIGGHYTFANVPFGWITDLLGSERNHFDRIGHFSVGFYAYPMMEWLLRKRHCGFKLAAFFSLFLS